VRKIRTPAIALATKLLKISGKLKLRDDYQRRKSTVDSNQPRHARGRIAAALLAARGVMHRASAGGAPLCVKILGETLALFRDDHGRIGLLGLHCSIAARI
jgi:hypothetical protein